MMKYINSNIISKLLLPLVASVLLMMSCDDILVTKPSSALSGDEVYDDYTRARAQLNECYKGIPMEPNIDLEYYTDNAVKNGKIFRAATGGMTAEESPVSDAWGNSVKYIMVINEYLEEGFRTGVYDIYKAEYSDALISRSKGEAYGLRAYYQWELLKNFAGPSAEDPTVMLGFPIMTSSLSIESVDSLPRATYLECMQQINDDIDSAFTMINIMRYDGNLEIDKDQNIGRVSGEMLLAMKARMYLYAASEAYQQVPWDTAAVVIYDAINKIDGTLKFLEKSYGSFNSMTNPDDLWRSRYNENSTLEDRHFPPSLYGKGECNPSQNLIDAFPTITGYPITNTWGGSYVSSRPYDSRDKRFEWFVFHDGENLFRDTTEIKTYAGGEDANGGILTIATRTGYYMKKYLSQTVNLVPSGSERKTKDISIYAIFTRQALYLDFAEAAYEAYGLEGKGAGMTFSAADVLQKVRFRAGIINDYYTNPLKNPFITIEDFKQLVKNERRVELAFEGERYFDVRRWKMPLDELNAGIVGMSINKSEDGTITYSDSLAVESRVFTEKMYYNPIPREEIIKSDVLIQNVQW